MFLIRGTTLPSIFAHGSEQALSLAMRGRASTSDAAARLGSPTNAEIRLWTKRGHERGTSQTGLWDFALPALWHS